jgi:hypothetical protein
MLQPQLLVSSLDVDDVDVHALLKQKKLVDSIILKILLFTRSLFFRRYFLF